MLFKILVLLLVLAVVLTIRKVDAQRDLHF